MIGHRRRSTYKADKIVNFTAVDGQSRQVIFGYPTLYFVYNSISVVFVF